MSDTPTTVLDHIDNISVPGNVFDEPANEYWALVCLRDGMEVLYRQAKQYDEVARKMVNPQGNVRFMGMGNLPIWQHVPRTLLTCGFHWYAISAYQYALTVGAIAHRHDNSKPIPPHYVRSVMPEVLAFRDKVAAHFAWAKNNSKDNDAERLASILPPITFVGDSFHVGAMTVAVRRGGKANDSSEIRPWSICKVHEQLRQRYWQDTRATEGESENQNASSH